MVQGLSGLGLSRAPNLTPKLLPRGLGFRGLGVLGFRV